MKAKKKVLRVAALSGSLGILLRGQLKFLNEHYEVKGVASEDDKLYELAEDEGIEVIPVTINRKISPIQDLKSLYRLYRVFKKEKPFIVHSITPKAGLVSMMAAYFAKVPHRLHTFTGLVFPTSTGILKQVLIFFDKVICFCATKIFPEGKGVKNDLVQYGITKKPLNIIGHGNVNGIDLSIFNPDLYRADDIAELKKELRILPEDFVFLFVGRMVQDKGITELVEAFKEVQKENKKVKLLVVGTYNKAACPFPKYIEEELNSNPAIIQVGWQTDVRHYFAISNILVFPSYREGFPNVVLQAGAMGKYSIVTDINGSNEIIKDGQNGKIIPVKDVHALKNEMLNCLKNKTNYITYNKTFRELIRSRYEQQFVWSATLDEYQKLNNYQSK